MTKIHFTFFLMSTFLLVRCGNKEDSNTSSQESSNLGIDYRVIMDKELNSLQVKQFFIDNKITENDLFVEIETNSNGIISHVDFGDACPAEYMPYNINSIMNKSIVEKTFGKPDKIKNRTYYYNELQLGIQFNSSGQRIQDISVYSMNFIK